MPELVRYLLDDGSHVLVQAAAGDGVTLTGRVGKTVDAVSSLAESLSSVRGAASEALRLFREGIDAPEHIEIEFGVVLNAEAGAIIAKTGVEGHMKIKLMWAKPHRNDAAEARVRP
jgi:hypothetical protein